MHQQKIVFTFNNRQEHPKHHTCSQQKESEQMDNTEVINMHFPACVCDINEQKNARQQNVAVNLV